MALIWKDRVNGWLHDEHNIKGFFGDYRWLSNFHQCSVDYRLIIFPSSENAYQAAKCADKDDMDRFINIAPSKAKYLGRNIRIREDWESVKLEVMEDILRIKFNLPELKQALIATKDKYLEETNWWNDRYWGVCNGLGLNHLGKILMKIRAEIA